MRRLSFLSPSMLAMRAGPSPRPKVLVLTGPTAVGKSSAALALCLALNGELISADSVQLYRSLNVASNKPSPRDRRLVPHHLLDIVAPSAPLFSAGDYFRAARAAMADVHARGRLPVVVGGTMMYVRWLLRGRPATPPASLAAKDRVRRALDAVAGDWEKAVALLAERDPKRARDLSRNDWYRLTRAMEVVETTGVPMTEMPLRGAAPNAEGELLDYDFRCVFLYADRVGLNRRIDERCEEMIVGGAQGEGKGTSVLEEVAQLVGSGELCVVQGSPALAIGYRQTIAYLVGRALAVGPQAVTEGEGEDEGGRSEAVSAFRTYVETFQAATRGYAKQQMAWFRKEQGFRWVRSGEEAVASVTAIMQLSEKEYRVCGEVGEAQQLDIREDMVRQGRLMKTYVAEKKVLVEGGERERMAVEMAERCAREMATMLEVAELKRIQRVVAR